MKKIIVTGMSCAACSRHVEEAVSKVSGVEECHVSLLTGEVGISGDFSLEEVENAVVKAGYGIGKKGAKKETKKEEKKGRGPFFLSLFLLCPLMYVSMGHMVSLPLPTFFTPLVQALVQFALSLATLLVHRRFFLFGIRALVKKSPTMDTLVSLGSGVSFLYSTALLLKMVFSPEEQNELLRSLYFDSAAMILVLISLGKLLEEISKGKTTSALEALKKLAPEKANVLRDGKEISLPLGELSVGDLAVVRPGENFPADGIVKTGEGAVDESALTGESIPVDKKEGDSVYTGTVNLSGKMVLEVTRAGEETTLSRIIERVTDAAASKAPIARLADKVSAVFVPAVLLISILTFAVWMITGASFSLALTRGISVLVVSCPCALGLATPTAIMVGNSVAARHGVLFKTASSLEVAGKTRVVVLDKTGTVTTGKMTLSQILPENGLSREELLSLSASLEEGSAHPLAQAVVEFARKENVSLLPVTDFVSHSGFGVEGVCEGKRVVAGKRELAERFAPLPESAVLEAGRLSGLGMTPVFVVRETAFCGLLALSDPIKEDSADAVSELENMGISVVMITGDRKETAEEVAKKVGITRLWAGVLPEEKEAIVKKLKEEGNVMMVGDGINDAPALAGADLGVAIGAGMEIAVDAAEVVLMRSSLSDLPGLIRLSRKTIQNIKENLFWAFCYNLVGIPLAAGVFVPLFGFGLTPMFGAAAMSFSSVLVVTNALRLNLFSWEKTKKEQKKEKKEMKVILKIEGMMCPKCEAHVKKALEEIAGVEKAVPSHEKGEAEIFLSEKLPLSLLEECVKKAGYEVTDSREIGD